MVNFQAWLSSNGLNLPPFSVESLLKLKEEGATVPFIARYRKEQTGGLKDFQIEAFFSLKDKWDHFSQRRASILADLNQQKKLTATLEQQINECSDVDRLEDLYFPYRQKKRSKSQAAKEAGLEPLADWIYACGNGLQSPQEGQTLEIWAYTYRNPEKGIETAEAAIEGALAILTERLTENLELKEQVRKFWFEHGLLETKRTDKAKENSKFERYFDARESIKVLFKPEHSHRYLAMKRGVAEQEISLSLVTENQDQEQAVIQLYHSALDSKGLPAFTHFLAKAADLAYRIYVFPSIEREIHRKLKAVADEAAISVFRSNLKTLLLAPPLGAKKVLAVDPGIRTGCKIAFVDETGALIEHGVFFLHSQEETDKAKKLVLDWIEKYNVAVIAVGNGTYGRETEIFIRKCLSETQRKIPVVLVNESGASVYSASEVAREEFGDLDITVRGTVSIARRLQDPLAELVKIDPKSIGVGQYQHDVNPNLLKKNLESTVDNCVHEVGVNVNTASPFLLARLSGIGESLAKAIVDYRKNTGLYKTKNQLKEVPGVSSKNFELAAGFFRVPESENVLDRTGIHPERFQVIQDYFTKNKKSLSSLRDEIEWLKQSQELKEALGPFTFKDVVNELEKPGRDPRKTFEPILFLDSLFEISDLKVGMVCPGIVSNVTNFGAFVDIGVHQDGLVHLSNMSFSFVKDPRDFCKPLDVVLVKVIEVNLEKKQIGLSMKLSPEEKASLSKSTAAKKPPKSKKPARPAFKNNPFSVLANLKDR